MNYGKMTQVTLFFQEELIIFQGKDLINLWQNVHKTYVEGWEYKKKR